MPHRRHVAVHRCLRSWSLAAALVIGGATAALACTTMVLGLKAHRLVAYSYDQPSSGSGMLVVNPVDVARSSIMDPPRAAWTARHGSVTFNQFGLGMPTAGMNTAGLVVTLTWNADASYGAPTGGPQLNELELIQHLLDTAATVDEAIAAARELHVQGLVPIHYFLVDRHGDAAGLRPRGGEFVVTRGADLPIPALTNDSYEELLANVAQFAPFGGSVALPAPETADDPESITRFAYAALAAEQSADGLTPAGAFGALDEVENLQTRWQIVFDPEAGEIWFRTADDDQTRRLGLADIDYACHVRPLAVDLAEAPLPSPADALRPLDPASIAHLLQEAFGSWRQFEAFGPDFFPAVAEAQIASFTCEA